MYACKMSRRMGKQTICIGKTKGADQLRSNSEADQHLWFRYTDSTIPLRSKSKVSSLLPAIFYECTVRYVSDMIGVQIVCFLTHMLKYYARSSIMLENTSQFHVIATNLLRCYTLLITCYPANWSIYQG